VGSHVFSDRRFGCDDACLIVSGYLMDSWPRGGGLPIVWRRHLGEQGAAAGV
jgi:hypothetical protein